MWIGIILLIIVSLGLAILLYYKHGQLLYLRGQLEQFGQTEARLMSDLQHQGQELKSLSEEHAALQAKLNEQLVQLRLVEQEREQLQLQLSESQKASQDLGKLLEERFKSITTRILDERSELLHKRNEESLSPLREDLKSFREQVQQVYQSEARERHSLQAEIHRLVEQSNRISSDANNLAQALKGENKLQGNWGEMILEDLLQHSGLERGRHYQVQEHFVDEATGAKLIPDVVINYPNGGRMIIDSKVNLKAYMEYVAAESEDNKQYHAKLHLEAVRKQIKDLHKKHYSHSVAGAPDFVIMFVPNEPAYLLALHQSPSLWQEAYDRKVLVMNATNLMAALKLAEELWRREQQQLNIEEIFKKVGEFYDKFCVYVEKLEKTSQHLSQAQNSLDETRKTLSEGRGNILRGFETLRKMGAKTKKRLGDIVAKSPILTMEGLDEDEIVD